MKFSKYLSYYMIPQWEGSFIDYHGLKYILNQAYARYKQRNQTETDSLLEDTDDSVEFRDEQPYTEEYFLQKVEEEIARILVFYHEKKELLKAQFEELNKSKLENFDEINKGFTKSPELKKKLSNLYHELQMLKNYASLNELGIIKIAHRYEKRFHRNKEGEYRKRAASMDFSTDRFAEETMTKIQKIYALTFEEGHMDQALSALRMNSKDETRTTILVILGLLMGVIITLIFVNILIIVFGPGPREFPHFQGIWPIYRATGLPILLLWCYGTILLACQRTHINYVYLLELDRYHSLRHYEVYLLAGILSILWLLSFTLFYLDGKDLIPPLDNIPLGMFPFVLALIMFLLFVCNPFLFGSHSTRLSLLKVIGNILLTPLGKLRFREFFLTDILTSMVKVFVDIGYTLCFIGSGLFLEKKSHPEGEHYECWNNNWLYVGPILIILPYWWRFLQCLRKFKETRNKLHLVNAGKYSVSILIVVFGALVPNALESTIWPPERIVWLILTFVGTIYSFMWDVLVDWGLGEFHQVKYVFLRQKRLFDSPKFYYISIVFDFFGRFFWAVTMIPNTMFSQMESQFVVVISSSVEIIRRSWWAVLRLENEMINNYEGYRNILKVPISVINQDKEDSIQ